jgi:hypothetical protein
MQGTINTDTVQAAVNLSQSHPQAKPVEVLDLVFQGRTGSLSGLGNLHPTSAFGQMIAAAFDPGMAPQDWRLIDSPLSPPPLVAVLRQIWRDQVLPAFAARYSLTL